MLRIGGKLPTRKERRTKRDVRRCDYSSLRVPLPHPPPGQEWKHDKETREWSVVDRLSLPTESSPLKKYQSGTEDALLQRQAIEDEGNVVFVEHVVLPTDTFQGLCLNYHISSTKLRQSNCFSGSVLNLAPKKLYIPVPKEALDQGLIRVQDPNSKPYKHHALMAEFPELRFREAKAFLEIAEWNLEEAVHEVKEAGFSEAGAARVGTSLIIRGGRGAGGGQHDEKDGSNFVVEAPSDMCAGFRFLVTVKKDQQRHDYLVEVPPGGVREGQQFTPLILPDKDYDEENGECYHPAVGAWKDDVCNCFDRGISNENCVAIWCRQLLLGQVQARNGLTFGGCVQDGDASTSHSFYTWLAVTVVVLLLGAAGAGVVHYVTAVYMVCLCSAIAVTRTTLRRRYAIPGNACGDCFCASFCSCCVVTQMARHTANYRRTPADCCLSVDGLVSVGGKEPPKPSKVGRLKDKFVVRAPLPEGGKEKGTLPVNDVDNKGGKRPDSPEAVGMLVAHSDGSVCEVDTRRDHAYSLGSAEAAIVQVELVETTHTAKFVSEPELHVV